MKSSHRVVKNTLILYGRMVITVFLSLYTTRVVLGFLGSEDFGIFNLVGGTIAMLAFLNASMAAATQRFMSFAHGQGSIDRQHKIFNVSIVLHAGVALVVLGILEGVGFVLFNGFLKIEPQRLHAALMVYQFAVISTFFTILSVPYDAVISAREHMLLFAVLGVVESILKLLIALFIEGVETDKLELYGFLMAVLSVILLLLRVGYCHTKYDECKLVLGRYFDRPLFKEMTSFAGWSFLGSSASIVANYGQGVVLNIFFGAKVNAAQGVSNQVSGQVSVLANIMQRALSPFIGKAEGAGNRDLMVKASVSGSKISFFLLVIIYVPILIEMPYIFKVWLKDVPAYAVIFCQFQLLKNLVEQFYITLAVTISSVGEIKNYQIVMSVVSLLPLIASYLLFQKGSEPYYMYICFIAYAFMALLITLFFARKIFLLPVKVYVKDVIFRCAGVFAIIFMLSSITQFYIELGIGRLIVTCLISFFSGIGTIWFIGLIQSERELAVNILGSTVDRFCGKKRIFR